MSELLTYVIVIDDQDYIIIYLENSLSPEHRQIRLEQRTVKNYDINIPSKYSHLAGDLTPSSGERGILTPYTKHVMTDGG